MSYDQVQAIPGWLSRVDFACFEFVLARQVASGVVGDLAELGVYLGKSAVVIGGWQQPHETFTVVDLFSGNDGADEANRVEQAREYPDLARSRFERFYLGVHPALPTVVEGLSHTIVDGAAVGEHRFVHVDAGHLYEQVRGDIAAAHTLLRPDGVLVLDDVRSAHTPGVAAAGWAAVADGLHPILISEGKLYATWGDPGCWVGELAGWLPGSGLLFEVQDVAGCRVHRVWGAPRLVARARRTVSRGVAAGFVQAGRARRLVSRG